MTTTHKCPGCGALGIPHAQLSCKPCWFRLPRPLRREVDAAYRIRGRDTRRHLLAVGAASRWWRANPPAPVLEPGPA